MKGTVLVVHVNGHEDRHEFDAPVTLDWLQHPQAINGYIEIVPYFNIWVDDVSGKGKECVVFCDEEGKLKGLPVNAKATAYWAARGDDKLVGPIAIVFGDAEFMEAL